MLGLHPTPWWSRSTALPLSFMALIQRNIRFPISSSTTTSSSCLTLLSISQLSRQLQVPPLVAPVMLELHQVPPWWLIGATSFLSLSMTLIQSMGFPTLNSTTISPGCLIKLIRTNLPFCFQRAIFSLVFFTASTAFSVIFHGFNTMFSFRQHLLDIGTFFMDLLAFIFECHHLFLVSTIPICLTSASVFFMDPLALYLSATIFFLGIIPIQLLPFFKLQVTLHFYDVVLVLPGNVYTYPHLPTYLTITTIYYSCF